MNTWGIALSNCSPSPPERCQTVPTSDFGGHPGNDLVTNPRPRLRVHPKRVAKGSKRYPKRSSQSQHHWDKPQQGHPGIMTWKCGPTYAAKTWGYIGFGLRVSAIQQNRKKLKKVTSTAGKRPWNDSPREPTCNERHLTARTKSERVKATGPVLPATPIPPYDSPVHQGVALGVYT